MFSGETAVELTTRLSDEAFFRRVEDALADLGRVRVDRRGGLTVGPPTAGRVVPHRGGRWTARSARWVTAQYDVAVRYDCRPTTGCWVLAVALFFFTFFGAAWWCWCR